MDVKVITVNYFTLSAKKPFGHPVYVLTHTKLNSPSVRQKVFSTSL